MRPDPRMFSWRLGFLASAHRACKQGRGTVPNMHIQRAVLHVHTWTCWRVEPTRISFPCTMVRFMIDSMNGQDTYFTIWFFRVLRKYSRTRDVYGELKTSPLFTATFIGAASHEHSRYLRVRFIERTRFGYCWCVELLALWTLVELETLSWFVLYKVHVQTNMWCNHAEASSTCNVTNTSSCSDISRLTEPQILGWARTLFSILHDLMTAHISLLS